MFKPVEEALKKPKRVVVPTNLSEDYQPQWGDREGVRELVQNWFDGIQREYRLSGPEDVEIRKSGPTNGKSFRFDAFQQLQGPSSSRIQKKDREVLGYIKFSEKENVLGMGVTDKRHTEFDFIGGHGEGMKESLRLFVTSTKCSILQPENDGNSRFLPGSSGQFLI
ncbi:hypothetical protein L218DRAFT_224772 [Marasmius fiardii PR-910]|nr:hypothetical protein L218DRAFT_224772 [Marasmius fiardii PR-910]